MLFIGSADYICKLLLLGRSNRIVCGCCFGGFCGFRCFSCLFVLCRLVALVDDEDEELSLSGFFAQDASAVSITATRISAIIFFILNFCLSSAVLRVFGSFSDSFPPNYTN